MRIQTPVHPAHITERLVRFIAGEVNRAGMRTHLVATLGTDYKRINRFITLQQGERPSRDVTFMMEILAALGFDAREVFDAAHLSADPEIMRLQLRDRRSGPKPAPTLWLEGEPGPEPLIRDP